MQRICNVRQWHRQCDEDFARVIPGKINEENLY